MKIGKTNIDFDFILLVIIPLFVLPFFGTSKTIDPVLTLRFVIWATLTLVLFIKLLIALRRASSYTNILRRMIFPAFACYLLFSVVSLTKAINVTEGVYEVLKIFVSIAYLFLATKNLSRNKCYIAIIVKAIVISSMILSVICFFQYFTQFFNTSYAACNITGTMAQRNQLSSALFLMMPFCLYAMLAFRTYWKIISFVAMVPLLTIILLNQTRSVWLAIAVSGLATATIVLLLFLQEKFQVPTEARVGMGRGCLLAFLALICSVGLFSCLHFKSNSVGSVVGRVESIISPSHSNNSIRISMWRQTYELAQNNPVCGIGAGNWKISFPSYGIEDFPDQRMFKTEYFVRPENDYLWVLSEIGIAGFLFYLAIFVTILIYIFKIIIGSSSLNDKLLSIHIFFGIIGYMVFSFFTFPKERIFHSMFLIMMMAMVTSIYHRLRPETKTVSNRFVLWLSLPCIAILIFAVIVGYYRMNAEIYTKRALAARKASNWPAVIVEIDKGYSKWAMLDPMSTPLKWYRGEANYMMNNIPEALEDFKMAYKAHPYHIHVLNNLAGSYETMGEHEKAIEYYNMALDIYPQFEDVLINLGAVYYNAGRYQDAFETLSRCNQDKENARLQKYLKIVKNELDKKR